MNFEVDEETTRKIEDWIDGVYSKLIEEQKRDPKLACDMFARDCWRSGVPYLGAIGGGVTYMFSPTSLGTVIKVSCIEEEKDFTDYGSW